MSVNIVFCSVIVSSIGSVESYFAKVRMQYLKQFFVFILPFARVIVKTVRYFLPHQSYTMSTGLKLLSARNTCCCYLQHHSLRSHDRRLL